MSAKLLLTTAIAVSFFLLFTSFLGFYISIKPVRFSSPATPADYGLEYENVKFNTEDGLTIRGWFIHASGQPAQKTIVGLHGYPADKGNILPVLAELSDAYNILLFDFRYLGESDGKITTAGAREVKDLLAAVGFLKERGIEDVGIWGFSMGGAVALMGQERAPGISAVISDSAYANLEDMTKELYRIPLIDRPLGKLTASWSHVILGIHPRNVSPADSIRDSDIPILIIHSKDDEITPFGHALKLQEALGNNPDAEFWFVEGVSHGRTTAGYRDRIRRFFDENL